jgi:predicted DNA-binding transcriptional regulator YafY
LDLDGEEDGWIRLRLRMEWPEDAAARLVGMGADLEVLEPAELRNQVLELARGSLARHGVTV